LFSFLKLAHAIVLVPTTVGKSALTSGQICSEVDKYNFVLQFVLILALMKLLHMLM